MDSLTHLAIGACTGELIVGRQLGKKAILWGALAANIPDIDTIAGLFVRGDKALLIHRGLTHSLFIALLLGLCMAIGAHRIKREISLALLVFFFCFELFLHDLLDTCTSYGTGLLEPFIHTRFSVNIIYVADPLFTIGLLVAAIYLIWGRKYRSTWAYSALFISALYLCVAAFNKVKIDRVSKASLTTPAPFTIFLWYCIRKTNDGYYTGYVSVFDQQPVSYTYHPRNDSFLYQQEPFLSTFANGYYTISRSKGNSYFNVLRFEQIQGWQNKNALFALSYPLKPAGDENMIIQKGRLKGWNPHAITQYLERIVGN